MPTKDRNEYMREYYLKNKERDKEKLKERRRLYSIKNREHFNQQRRDHYKTEKGKKSNRINGWKQVGVICEDFDKMYDTYNDTKNCSWCNKEFGKKNIEHNHSSGEIRGVVCHTCNQKIACKDRNYQKCMLDLVSLFVK